MEKRKRGRMGEKKERARLRERRTEREEVWSKINKKGKRRV